MNLSQKPLVSVIIPNYNHARFLNERIDSILNQTYKNFELIILDDKSNDDSRCVIESYKANPHVSHIIFNEQNSGSTFIQWNKGFSLAKGELILIAESDDKADVNLLEKSVRTLIENPKAVLCFCKSIVIDENGSIQNRELYSGKKWRDSFVMNGKNFIRRNMLSGNSICNASAVLFHKSCLDNLDQNYMKYKASGDRAFWINIALQGDVCYLADPLNMFRKHSNEVSPKAAAKGITMMEDFDIYNSFQKKHGLSFFDKVLINSNHYRAIREFPYFEDGAREQVLKTWHQSPYFCYPTYFLVSIVKYIYKKTK